MTFQFSDLRPEGMRNSSVPDIVVPEADGRVAVFNLGDGRAAGVAARFVQVMLVTDNALLGAGLAHLLGMQLHLTGRLVATTPCRAWHCAVLFPGSPDLLVLDTATALTAAPAWLDEGTARLRLVHGEPAGKHEVSVHAPLSVLQQALHGALLHAGQPREAQPQSKALSPRQREVMALMRHGLSNKEIAQRMSLAPGTVKLHAAAVLRALNARNRLQLIARAEAALTCAAPALADPGRMRKSILEGRPA
jgi:DNA-binding CsgD family transcriptional regulator